MFPRTDISNTQVAYQAYGGGHTYENVVDRYWAGYRSGLPYVGEVYYGNDGEGRELGTTGHYVDFSILANREWWGTQYQYLFDSGLEMVWQDMTTPAIRENRGDMKGFPFRLKIGNNFYSD